MMRNYKERVEGQTLDSIIPLLNDHRRNRIVMEVQDYVWKGIWHQVARPLKDHILIRLEHLGSDV